MMVALGVVLVTCVTRNTHLGVEAVLGNIDALHRHDLEHICVIAGVDLLCIVPFLSRWKLVTFDPQFAGTQGVRPGIWETFLLLLTALTTVGAFRAVGILLVLSFLVGPVLIARLWTHRLKQLLLVASLLGMLLSLIGVGLARHLFSVHDLPLSTAGIVSTLIGLSYFMCWGVAAFRRSNA
jgi:manganese/zinc/iron transport system permease protein